MTFIKNASYHSSSVGAVKLHGVSHFCFSMFAWARVSPMVGSENPAVLDGKVVAITGKNFYFGPQSSHDFEVKLQEPMLALEGRLQLTSIKEEPQ